MPLVAHSPDLSGFAGLLAGSECGARREALVAQLHERHFLRLAARPTADTVLRVLWCLARSEALRGFAVFVVGSAVYAPRRCRDLDLLLTDCSGRRRAPEIAEIEAALLECVAVGRALADISVDPIYRPADEPPPLVACRLEPDRIFHSIRLEDPGTTFRMAAGLAPNARKVGRMSARLKSEAAACSFYRKLPLDAETGLPWLAGAVPLTDMLVRCACRAAPRR